MVALPETGVPFGKYLLIRRLAVGGMAEIWLARPIDGAGKPLVIKRILPQFASDPEFTARFREEAALTLQLVHGNIVPVFEIGSVGDEPYIAMEHVPGYDLRTVLKRSREKGLIAPPGVAAYVGVELLRGLDYAHRKMDGSGRALHLVHRDVSPSNVVVSWEGTVKLLDFGIAKAIGRAEATRTGVLRGKIGYMSPEQARGDAIGPATDLFSTGVVLYELLTAQRLFEGDSEPELLERVKTAEIPRVRTRNAAVPEPLDEILARALRRDPRDRWTSAGEFLSALNRWVVGSGLPADAAATTAFLRELFPEDTVAEEFDARTATHGIAATPAASRVSPIALQLGGGLAVTPPPAAGTPPPVAASRGALYVVGALALVAILATVGLAGGGFRGKGEAVAALTGALHVHSVPPGATVRIDGEEQGPVTPDVFKGLEPGPHDVELSLPDYETWTGRAVVTAGDVERVTATLRPDERTIRVETDPPGASVSIPAGQRCVAPCSFSRLKPSETVEVTATLAGHRRESARVRVADVSDAVRIRLEREGPATPVAARTATPAPTIAAPPVRVSFRILPFGKFRIGGDGTVHDGFVKALPLAVGTHEVRVTNENGVNAICSVTLAASDEGKTLKLDFRGPLPENCRSGS